MLPVGVEERSLGEGPPVRLEMTLEYDDPLVDRLGGLEFVGCTKRSWKSL